MAESEWLKSGQTNLYFLACLLLQPRKKNPGFVAVSMRACGHSRATSETRWGIIKDMGSVAFLLQMRINRRRIFVIVGQILRSGKTKEGVGIVCVMSLLTFIGHGYDGKPCYVTWHTN